MKRNLFESAMCDFVSFWILTTIAVAIGMMLNQLRDRPLPLVYQTEAERLGLGIVNSGTSQSAGEEVLPLTNNLSLTGFKTFVDSKAGLVLDARPEIFFRSGHVPGALSLPRVDFDSAFSRLKDALERNKQQPIIVYCSGHLCEDSHLVQAALIKRGYTHVSIFEEGWPAWSRAHLPEEKAP